MLELTPQLEAWVKTLPPNVEKTVRAKPPTVCYRSIENDGHYWLEGITENDGVVAYTILHGSDSFLPGFRVYHVNPDTLMPCACGKFHRPSTEQIDSAQAVADAMLKAAMAARPG